MTGHIFVLISIKILKMKKRTILFIIALLPLVSLLNAHTLLPPPDDGEPIDLNGVRPPKPRSIEPECYYLDGCVYVIGDNSVTSISGTVTRLSDNMQWSNSCTGNALQIAVPTDAGSYHLTLSLSDGSSYYGDYTL